MNGPKSLHLCLNYDFFFLFQGKAVTDNCKINYGGPTDRGEKTERQEADSDEEGERGVSGKHSNEKTSDFWASHRQPFQGLKTHSPAHTHTHSGKCLLAVRFMC